MDLQNSAMHFQAISGLFLCKSANIATPSSVCRGLQPDRQAQLARRCPHEDGGPPAVRTGSCLKSPPRIPPSRRRRRNVAARRRRQGSLDGQLRRSPACHGRHLVQFGYRRFLVVGRRSLPSARNGRIRHPHRRQRRGLRHDALTPSRNTLPLVPVRHES